MKTITSGPPAFRVYAAGLCYASVCTSLTAEEAERALNREEPAGTEHGWSLAEEPFADGTPNGTACQEWPETHRHWLFAC